MTWSAPLAFISSDFWLCSKISKSSWARVSSAFPRPCHCLGNDASVSLLINWWVSASRCVSVFAWCQKPRKSSIKSRPRADSCAEMGPSFLGRGRGVQVQDGAKVWTGPPSREAKQGQARNSYCSKSIVVSMLIRMFWDISLSHPYTPPWEITLATLMGSSPMNHVMMASQHLPGSNKA